MLTQSRAIYRHVARVHGLAGDSEADLSLIDSLAEGTRDWAAPAGDFPFNADVAGARAKLEAARDRFGAGFERVLVRARGD